MTLDARKRLALHGAAALVMAFATLGAPGWGRASATAAPRADLLPLPTIPLTTIALPTIPLTFPLPTLATSLPVSTTLPPLAVTVPTTATVSTVTTVTVAVPTTVGAPLPTTTPAGAPAPSARALPVTTVGGAATDAGGPGRSTAPPPGVPGPDGSSAGGTPAAGPGPEAAGSSRGDSRTSGRSDAAARGAVDEGLVRAALSRLGSAPGPTQRIGGYAFPTGLALLILGFLLVQHRLDRDDPKIADAPLDGADETLEFVKRPR